MSPVTTQWIRQRYCHLSVSRKKRESQTKHLSLNFHRISGRNEHLLIDRYYICKIYVNEVVENRMNKLHNTDISLSAVNTDIIDPAFTLMYYFEKKKQRAIFRVSVELQKQEWSLWELQNSNNNTVSLPRIDSRRTRITTCLFKERVTVSFGKKQKKRSEGPGLSFRSIKVVWRTKNNVRTQECPLLDTEKQKENALS